MRTSRASRSQSRQPDPARHAEATTTTIATAACRRDHGKHHPASSPTLALTSVRSGSAATPRHSFQLPVSPPDMASRDRHGLSRGPRWPSPTSQATFSWTALVIACLLVLPASAVRIPFENCLPDSYRFNDPLPLQFEPLYVDARFDTESENHNLHVTLWGNTTGSHFQVPLPPPGDSHWDDPDEEDGKILRVPDPDNPSRTTVVTRVEFLSYRPYRENSDFCDDKLTNASCPLGPVFNTTDL